MMEIYDEKILINKNEIEFIKNNEKSVNFRDHENKEIKIFIEVFFSLTKFKVEAIKYFNS